MTSMRCPAKGVRITLLVFAILTFILLAASMGVWAYAYSEISPYQPKIVYTFAQSAIANFDMVMVLILDIWFVLMIALNVVALNCLGGWKHANRWDKIKLVAGMDLFMALVALALCSYQINQARVVLNQLLQLRRGFLGELEPSESMNGALATYGLLMAGACFGDITVIIGTIMAIVLLAH